MSNPREGTFDSLKAGLDNKAFNAQVFFYNTLRLLEVTQEISNYNFTDHPALSQELVKFLLLNTLVEDVDTLTSKMKGVETKETTLDSDVKGADKTATTIGNKCDDRGTQFKDLIKRLTKLKKDK